MGEIHSSIHSSLVGRDALNQHPLTAIKATQAGYMEVKVQGTAYVIPYYAKA